MNIGDRWNESQTGNDELTRRLVRRLTTCGRINQTPTYHTNSGFTADGSALCYHGNARGGGGYFEVAKTNGEVVWERVFPEAITYGHNTPDARRKALIIDGSFSRDRLQ